VTCLVSVDSVCSQHTSRRVSFSFVLNEPEGAAAAATKIRDSPAPNTRTNYAPDRVGSQPGGGASSLVDKSVGRVDAQDRPGQCCSVPGPEIKEFAVEETTKQQSRDDGGGGCRCVVDSASQVPNSKPCRFCQVRMDGMGCPTGGMWAGVPG